MKNLYVGNLAFSATEEELRALFEPYGPIDNITLVRDRDTGQPRGFGFVELGSDEQAEKAIAALNGQNVGGRNINVNEARPKADRGGRGGFGGGGGGRDRGGRGGYGGGGHNRSY